MSCQKSMQQLWKHMGLVSTRELIPACMDNYPVPACHSFLSWDTGDKSKHLCSLNENLFGEIFMVFSTGALSNPSNMLGREGDCTHPPALNLLKTQWWLIELMTSKAWLLFHLPVKCRMCKTSCSYTLRGHSCQSPLCFITSPTDCHSSHGNAGPDSCTRENKDKDRWRHTITNNISFGLLSWWRMAVCYVLLFVFHLCISFIAMSLLLDPRSKFAVIFWLP